MPARKISSQSFDAILSELGDDPAIPDPHGIRKSNSPNRPDWEGMDRPQNRPKTQLGFQDQIPIPEGLKKLMPALAVGGILIASGIWLFVTLSPIESDGDIHPEAVLQDISALKKELATLREEILEFEDAIYETIDKLEVSIHSLKKNKAQTHPKGKPSPLPFEAEISRWRYLGVSQAGSTYRAFFHNSKSTLMVEMGGLLLGDWRLSNANKEAATITHPQGKSFIIKAAISE